jgi:hypothetical protein
MYLSCFALLPEGAAEGHRLDIGNAYNRYPRTAETVGVVAAYQLCTVLIRFNQQAMEASAFRK